MTTLTTLEDEILNYIQDLGLEAGDTLPYLNVIAKELNKDPSRIKESIENLVELEYLEKVNDYKEPAHPIKYKVSAEVKFEDIVVPAKVAKAYKYAYAVCEYILRKKCFPGEVIGATRDLMAHEQIKEERNNLAYSRKLMVQQGLIKTEGYTRWQIMSVNDKLTQSQVVLLCEKIKRDCVNKEVKSIRSKTTADYLEAYFFQGGYYLEKEAEMTPANTAKVRIIREGNKFYRLECIEVVDSLRKSALAKLTEAEKRALGLI